MRTNTKQNQVPEGWQELNLAEVCDFERGVEPGAKNYLSDASKTRFLRVADLTGSRSEKVYVDLETDKAVTKDDILISLDGSIGVVRKGLEGIFSSGVRKASFKDARRQSDRLLYYLLQSKKIQKTIQEHATGSTIKHAGKSIAYMTVAVPTNIKEQEKIAEILEAVDEDIAKTDALIAETEKLKQGLMQQLFTRGIGHTKFKKTNLGEIPEEWKVKTGEDISSLITKGASPKWQGYEYGSGGMLFITSENVRNGFLDIESPKYLPMQFHEKLKNSQLKKDDILINIVGASIARSCLYDGQYPHTNINQAVCLMRLNEQILPLFMLQYLQHPLTISRLLESQGGSARQNLSLGDIRKFKFIVPDLDEQKKIAGILTEVDGKNSENKKAKGKLRKLKEGLMQDLLTGNVRVNIS